MNNIFKKTKPRMTSHVDRLRQELNAGSDNVRYCMNIPRDIHTRFKSYAFAHGVDMKDILMEAIMEVIRKTPS